MSNCVGLLLASLNTFPGKTFRALIVESTALQLTMLHCKQESARGVSAMARISRTTKRVEVGLTVSVAQCLVLNVFAGLCLLFMHKDGWCLGSICRFGCCTEVSVSLAWCVSHSLPNADSCRFLFCVHGHLNQNSILHVFVERL